MTDLYKTAREMGADYGRAVASWYFDGNTRDETYRAVLAGIEEGDPEIMDTFPHSPLSGEWAGEPTPGSILSELGVSDEDPCADDLLQVYEVSFYQASQEEIERVARYHCQ